MGRKPKYDHFRDEVERLLDENKTTTEIAAGLDIPYGSICYLIKKWGLQHKQVRHTGNYSQETRKKFGGKSKYEHLKDDVERLLDKNLAVTEIADRLGIAQGSIGYLVRGWGLQHKQVRHTGNYGKKTRAAWSRAYKEIHASGMTSGENHWSHGLLKLHGEFVPEDEVKMVLEEFREQDLTLAAMAEECGVSPKTITNQLKRFGLQGGLRSGDRCSWWKGGHSKYRGPGWFSIRKDILERDGYSCRQCGKTQDEARADGHGLSVHHVVPFEQTQDNSYDNLITLCQHCHMVAEWELGSH